MRKSRRKQVIIVKNEIDYDKLAETMTRVNKVDERPVEETEEQQKESFWKIVYYIIFNKKPMNGTMTAGVFSLMVSSFFNILALLGIGTVLLGIVGIVLFFINAQWTQDRILGNVLGIIAIVFTICMIALFSLVLRGSANEMSIEKDRNYIVAVFSGVVSLVALVIALIALFQDNGNQQIIELLGEIKNVIVNIEKR